jgi:hypothetical protein
VRSLKATGIKTEPAFAQALGLSGDPYQTLLAMYDALYGATRGKNLPWRPWNKRKQLFY